MVNKSQVIIQLVKKTIIFILSTIIITIAVVVIYIFLPEKNPFIERKGRHQELYLLNFIPDNPKNENVEITLSKLERISAFKEKERILKSIEGERAEAIIKEMQKLYEQADTIDVRTPENSKLGPSLWFDFSANGAWSIAKIKRFKSLDYVAFFPENISSSFRIIELRLLPLEIREVLSEPFFQK